MSAPDDVHYLTRRIDTLTRAATAIRRHLPDLHVLAHEPMVTTTEPSRATGFESRPPPGANHDSPYRDRSQHLWSRISLQVGQIEGILVGLERQLTAHFYAGSQSPEPSRGSLIPAAEHDTLLAKQRARRAAGEYAPTPLVEQPRHPGAGR